MVLRAFNNQIAEHSRRLPSPGVVPCATRPKRSMLFGPPPPPQRGWYGRRRSGACGDVLSALLLLMLPPVNNTVFSFCCLRACALTQQWDWLCVLSWTEPCSERASGCLVRYLWSECLCVSIRKLRIDQTTISRSIPRPHILPYAIPEHTRITFNKAECPRIGAVDALSGFVRCQLILFGLRDITFIICPSRIVQLKLCKGKVPFDRIISLCYYFSRKWIASSYRSIIKIYSF